MCRSPPKQLSRTLNVCCGIWLQNVSNRLFKFCKIQGGASMDYARSAHTHSCLTELSSGKIRGQANSFTLLKPFQNNRYSVTEYIILLIEAISIWESTWRGVLGRWYVSSNVHMNGRIHTAFIPWCILLSSSPQASNTHSPSYPYAVINSDQTWPLSFIAP